ncbi:MAG: hypothetical protein ACERKN_03810 [Velocimicrobium sp.]
MNKLREKLQGNITFSKSEFALIVAIASLGGILVGLLTAPFTHGFSFSVGNNSGNTYETFEDEEDMEDK